MKIPSLYYFTSIPKKQAMRSKSVISNFFTMDCLKS